MANLGTSPLVTISVVCVFLLLSAQTVTGIMCFQCNSARDRGCADITGNSTQSSYYRLCEPMHGQTRHFFCRTITQTIKDRENVVRVVRSCGWERHPTKNCYEYDDADHHERVCQCFQDGCNSRAAHAFNQSWFASLVCLLLVAMLYRRDPLSLL